MSGGRGFLVLADHRAPHPVGVRAGALLFAGLDGVALVAQTRDLGLPTEAYYGVPYLTAMMVLCLTSTTVSATPGASIPRRVSGTQTRTSRSVRRHALLQSRPLPLNVRRDLRIGRHEHLQCLLDLGTAVVALAECVGNHAELA
jgi:hypothetical protein